jgi:nuclear pore complex protein Nup214
LEHFLTVSDVKEKPSGPQQNPLFKWVKESTGSSQMSEQKHFELPGQMKSTAQSSKLTPSFSYTHMGAQDIINPSSVPSFGTKHTVSKPNSLTFKTTITSKSNAHTERNILPSIIAAKTSQSPLSVKTTGESGGLPTLTMKNRQDSQVNAIFGEHKRTGCFSAEQGWHIWRSWQIVFYF